MTPHNRPLNPLSGMTQTHYIWGVNIIIMENDENLKIFTI